MTPVGGAVVSRFAPSPTGRLHLGHAYSAVLAHDAARAGGGRFLLRIEDLDEGRRRPEHEAAILDDLAWLGIGWDGFSRQSERGALYAAALGRLRAEGLAYPCFCTRAEVAAAAAAAPHGVPPPYPGTCRGIDAGSRMGEPHAWRLDARAAAARAGAVRWHDADAGWVTADPLVNGDAVLRRRDGGAAYHLAAVVDDADQGVTLVVRGHDLFDATHVHRLIQAALDLPTPCYRHHALVTDENGERLAKRRGSAALADRRAGGEDGKKLAAGLRAGRLPAGFGLASD